MLHSSGSLLLDLDGVVVESVRRVADGSRIVRLGTDPPTGRGVPAVRAEVDTAEGLGDHPSPRCAGRPRPSRLEWNKRKWLCTNTSCDRKVFAESVPGIPPRARVTPRAKTTMAAGVLDDDRSVSAVAAEYRCGWHTVHDRVVAVADTALDDEPGPVTVLGIDESPKDYVQGGTPTAAAKRSGRPTR